ncbi:MAG: YdjY domain-containing protein, partial [Akkermansiaceae bacterium]
PMVKKLANGNYQIGLITFNQKTREISIPARTEIVAPGSVLEYLLVHTNGEKVHEALLTSDADPTHLNIALKLLRYKESQELFRELKADGTPGDTYPAVPEETRKAARFSIHVTYKHQGKDKTVLVSDWIQHHATKKPMPKTAWVYNGSYIHDKKFKAKINGNMLSILTDLSAIANYSGDDREDDTIWFPAPRIPAGGTKVTVTLKPWKQ